MFLKFNYEQQIMLNKYCSPEVSLKLIWEVALKRAAVAVPEQSQSAVDFM